MTEHRSDSDSLLEGLDERHLELASRMRRLKEDMQGWRIKLDTQIKTYKAELFELKSSLNVELEQLKSEFQDVRVTLKEQQDEVTKGLDALKLDGLPKELQQIDRSKGNEGGVETKEVAPEDVKILHNNGEEP